MDGRDYTLIFTFSHPFLATELLIARATWNLGMDTSNLDSFAAKHNQEIML
jgi:hypothetical protein